MSSKKPINQKQKPFAKAVKTPAKSTKKGNPVIQDLTKLIKSVDIKQIMLKNMAFVITGIILGHVQKGVKMGTKEESEV